MKRSGVSPDAFIQLAIQLAYYRDAGQFALTYEASMTRLYRHGRTETVRSLSTQSVTFVEQMEAYLEARAAANASGGGDGGGSGARGGSGGGSGGKASRSVAEAEKTAVGALRAAAAHHAQLYKDAMSGRGVDRHLFALYIVSKGMELDSPFLENALSMPWKLSTSQTTPQQTNRRQQLPEEIRAQFFPPGGGFGPVHDDGYGVSYMVAGEDALFFHVSSKMMSDKTDSKRLGDRIVEALGDMKTLCELDS